MVYDTKKTQVILTGSSVMLCRRASTILAELDARSDAIDTSLPVSAKQGEMGEGR